MKIIPIACKSIEMGDLQWKSVLYQLRSQIVSGEFTGGTKLRASHLAEQMNASRTPISEALIKLEGEGLLVRDKSGFTVRSFALSEVYDAIDLRGLLEGAAVQRAAERGIDASEINQLHDRLSELDKVISDGQVTEYDQLNVDFHKSITELSGSDILIAEVQRSYRFPFAGPSAFPARFRDSERFQASLVIGQHHHQQVVKAIADGAGSRAASLMVEHAKLAHQNVAVAVKAHEAPPQLALVREAH